MKNKYRMWIAEKLVSGRLSMRMSQKQLAEIIELKLRTYQAYEESRAEPSIFTLEKICTALKTTLNEFMADSPLKTVKD